MFPLAVHLDRFMYVLCTSGNIDLKVDLTWHFREEKYKKNIAELSFMYVVGGIKNFEFRADFTNINLS
jgi:hypothetical protein